MFVRSSLGVFLGRGGLFVCLLVFFAVVLAVEAYCSLVSSHQLFYSAQCEVSLGSSALGVCDWRLGTLAGSLTQPDL